MPGMDLEEGFTALVMRDGDDDGLGACDGGDADIGAPRSEGLRSVSGAEHLDVRADVALRDLHPHAVADGNEVRLGEAGLHEFPQVRDHAVVQVREDRRMPR